MSFYQYFDHDPLDPLTHLGAPGIVRITFNGAPEKLGNVSETLNALIHEQGLTLSKYDKG